MSSVLVEAKNVYQTSIGSDRAVVQARARSPRAAQNNPKIYSDRRTLFSRPRGTWARSRKHLSTDLFFRHGPDRANIYRRTPFFPTRARSRKNLSTDPFSTRAAGKRRERRHGRAWEAAEVKFELVPARGLVLQQVRARPARPAAASRPAACRHWPPRAGCAYA